MKHIFIVNKKAGKNDINLENNLYNLCKLQNLDFLIIEVDSEEKLREHARSYKNSDVIVYAVGGDGTIWAVLNEIMGGTAKLGVIPVGSGNDFYRSLDRMPSRKNQVNVMQVNDVYGINNFSLGIDALICENALKFKKLGINPNYIYHLSAIYTYFKYHNQVMGVNDFFQKNTMLTICNGSYYGGGHNIAPRASLESPEVSVLMARMPKIVMPVFWLEVMFGVHENSHFAELYQSDSLIHVESNWELTGQLDGEIMKNQEFNIVPHAGFIDVINNRELIRSLKK